ncbi:MAG: VOC family protein [Chloroflexota bacterium]|nr:VOC family protein [Chloroflexota bacterium]
MADEKILMVMMAVTEMAKSKTFYAEQLGWSVTTDYGEGDQHWVTLELPGGGASLSLSTMHGQMKPGTLTLYVSTSDIEAAHNALEAKGVKVHDVKDDLYGPGSGVKWFDLRDPDGNRWLMVQSEHGPR